MAPFDPYHKWLGISPDQQPASYYRLLGIEDCESDADVIEGAAEQRTIYLRTFQTGPNAELAEQLLNEVSAARVCLLNAADKADYDKRLQAALASGQPVAPKESKVRGRDFSFATAELPHDQDRRLFEGEELPAQETDPLAYTPDQWAMSEKEAAAQRHRAGKSRQPFWKEPWAIPAAAGGIVAFLLMLMWISSGGDPVSPGDKPGLADKADGPVTSSQEEDREAKRAADEAAADEAAADEAAVNSAMAPAPAVVPFDAQAAKQHQERWASHLETPVDITNSIGMKLKLIAPGEFMMGSPESDSDAPADEKPQHLVKITRPFYVGIYEVTQQQYEHVMGINPSHFRGPNSPVEQVTWNDAIEFCRKLSALPREEAAGRMYFLPTEAQWEYACRAGTDTKYCEGETPDRLDLYAWTGQNAGRRTHFVGGKNPNPWGLHDIRGNVYEWTHDWMQVDYYSKSPRVDPRGPDAGSFRVIRGGGWNNNSIANYRSASRGTVTGAKRQLRAGFIPGHSDSDVGFRVAVSVPVASDKRDVEKAAEIDRLEDYVALYVLTAPLAKQGYNYNVIATETELREWKTKLGGVSLGERLGYVRLKRKSGLVPLYRIRTEVKRRYLFRTFAEPERNAASALREKQLGWVGPRDLLQPSQAMVPVYTLTHPQTGRRRFTSDATTKATLVRQGWNQERILAYVFREAPPKAGSEKP